MSRLRRLLVAAGTVIVSTTVLVGPAAAADRGLIVELDGPGATETSSSPSVTGRVKAGDALLNLTPPQVQTITLRVVPAGGGPAVASTTQSPNREAPVSFSWTPSIPRNGNYRIEASASGTATLGLANASGDATRDFAVAAPPKPPQQVSAVVNPDGSVTVSWARNTEADMLGYRVFRMDPGLGTFYQVGPKDGIAHTACATRCELRDDSTATLGGDYGYQVLAFRAGPSQPLASAPSKTVSASVPVPTTTMPPGDPAAPGAAPGAPPVTKPALGSARGPAISNFLAAQPPAKPPPPPKVLEAPDTGFSRELPFGAIPDTEEEPGEEEAVIPEDAEEIMGEDAVSQGQPLVPVAAGLILLVIAGHLRLFMSRSRPAPGKAPRRAVPEPARARPSSPPARAGSRPTVTILPATAGDRRPSPLATTAPSRSAGRLLLDDLDRAPGARVADRYRGDADELEAEVDAIDAALRGRDRALYDLDKDLVGARAPAPAEEIEVALLAPPPPPRQPVGVGARREGSWDDGDVWEVVSPDR